jgi:hypothetical protein
MVTELVEKQLPFNNGIAGGECPPAVKNTTPFVAGVEPSPAPAPKLPVGKIADLSGPNFITSKPGMFWCYTHLADIPLSEQSADDRYCKKCYQVLAAEMADLRAIGDRHKHWWALQDKRHSNNGVVPVQGQPTHNLSTSNSKNITVDKLDPPVPVRPIVHPGPKNMALPLDRIAKLAAEGMGSKLIARRLNADGIKVSYRTIQRLLYNPSFVKSKVNDKNDNTSAEFCGSVKGGPAPNEVPIL